MRIAVVKIFILHARGTHSYEPVQSWYGRRCFKKNGNFPTRTVEFFKTKKTTNQKTAKYRLQWRRWEPKAIPDHYTNNYLHSPQNWMWNTCLACLMWNLMENPKITCINLFFHENVYFRDMGFLVNTIPLKISVDAPAERGIRREISV